MSIYQGNSDRLFPRLAICRLLGEKSHQQPYQTLKTLRVIMPTCQARCAHWCHSGIIVTGVANHFLVGFRPANTRGERSPINLLFFNIVLGGTENETRALFMPRKVSLHFNNFYFTHPLTIK